MSSLICLIVGLLVGSLTMFIGYNAAIQDKDNIIDDLYKGIDIHNKRELRLIFINQSIKDYVKEQKTILREHYKDAKVDSATNEEIVAAGNYAAYAAIENKIRLLEDEADKLQNK